MQLSKLLEGIPVQDFIYCDMEISALYTDSKKVQPNGLFFCLKGENYDGHAYAAEGVKNGAVALVCERRLSLSIPQIIVPSARAALAKISANFYQNPARELKIIGITGTNGKTTTSYLLASILEQAGKKVGVIGTLGVWFHGETWPTHLTTPDPIPLQETLRTLRDKGAEYVVMEVSAHALYYHKTEGIDFAACIFTNLSQDHLDFFQTMSVYKAAKMRFFTPQNCPLAIVNGDDEVGREIGALFENEQKMENLIFYGMQTPTDAFALITKEGLDGTECMLNIQDKLCRVSLSFIGIYNVYNALAAATCAFRLGISLTAIALGLQNQKRVRGRLEKVGEKNGACIYVDFAHTPDGLEKVLKTLK
jgi:UDP-N-acetylmuramoyl-L-alanyl-D-glutamate--2,6-diaminopimelate ligase